MMWYHTENPYGNQCNYPSHSSDSTSEPIEVNIHRCVYTHVHVQCTKTADLRSGVLGMLQKVLWPVSVDPVNLSHHSRRGH